MLEGNKQRFLYHPITAMKTPTLLTSIEADLEAGEDAGVGSGRRLRDLHLEVFAVQRDFSGDGEADRPGL